MKPRKWALVTGASGGIGIELARVFAHHNYNLVLTARRQAELGKLAQELETRGTQTRVIAADLADASAPQKIWEELQDEDIWIHTLVNNAGFATYGFFDETPLDDELQMLQVNIVALTQLTKLFLPAMKTRGRGQILNVASTAAFQPGPLMAVYYASKAYVLSFSEALSNELDGSGVTVSALCPGPTVSDFQERAKMMESKILQGDLMDAGSVALAGYRGLIRKQSVIVPGAKNQIFANAHRVLPRRLVAQIVRRAQGK